ncbi:MAG: hypothetical protein CVU73_02120 [Deltaproteobacteria bacterium HGW-Deltaproteobacteria-8]|jgi:hypothetical protein|nr:MAG: hypothetical protein CVU73_02120 [Deltaproteobacteria bacterium HGW-Deltaproteobacteria-8]
MEPEKLDTKKFAKIYSLMNSTTYDGEREAARDRAEAVACAAGMTFDEAVEVISTPDKAMADVTPAWKNPFEGFADYMEEQEPGYKARAAEEARVRELELMKQRADLVERYGSEEAVFTECDKEAMLLKACQHLSEVDEGYGYVSKLDGWDILSSDADLPDSVRQAVSHAYALPTSVIDALAERRYWGQRGMERQTFDRDYDFVLPVRARLVVLEELIMSLPAQSIEDVLARLDNYEELCHQGFDLEITVQDNFIKQFRNDIGFLSNGVQVGRQAPFTNAKKRDAVLEYLKCPERSLLSDREIARIVGVSPQTVNNWRKRLNVQFGHRQ